MYSTASQLGALQGKVNEWRSQQNQPALKSYKTLYDENYKVIRVEAGYAAEQAAFGQVLTPAASQQIFGPYIKKK